jgi:DASH complex subunit ASK1
MSSPFIPPSSHKPSTAKRTNNNKKPTDPVLHHVLDKTYRVQATPLSKSSYKPTKFTVSTPKDKPPRYTFDDSPISSPELEAPKLHEEIFSSPLKGMSNTPGTGRRTRRRSSSSPNKRTTPRPGVSVLTPGKPKTTATTRIAKGSWDSDDDDDFGRYTTDDDDTGAPYEMSPPKTMQFHIPQSRLMKTPGKPLLHSYTYIHIYTFCVLTSFQPKKHPNVLYQIFLPQPAAAVMKTTTTRAMQSINTIKPRVATMKRLVRL